MATLATQRARAQAINRENVINAIFEFVKKVESELVALNRKQLNEDSIDVIGEALGFYTRATEFITTNDALLGKDVRIKKAGQPYDLLQEGNLLDSIFIQISNNVVIFGSSDPKLPLVLDNPQLQGKQLFGLTEENTKHVIRTFILPFYQKLIRAKLEI